jgi:osmoprotectant transport system ATP-binding protein
MGDRIAILRQGGILAQYATPDEILAAPADDFVARFVGADRGLKRLSLRRLSEIDLLDAGGTRPDGVATARSDTTLRDALSIMLTSGSDKLLVLRDDGEPAGLLTVELVGRMLSEPEVQAPA